MFATFSMYGYSSTELDSAPDVSNWSTSNVKDFYDTFDSYGYTSKVLSQTPDVGKWNTSKAERMD